MKVQIKEQVEKTASGERRSKQARVEVHNGDFHQVFEDKDEPFDVSADVWQMLKRTGEFEIAEEAPPVERQEEEKQEEEKREEQGDAITGAPSSDASSDAPARRARQPRVSTKQ